VAGNTPLDLLKEVPIRPKEEIRELNDEVGNQLCRLCGVDDEKEIRFGGEEAVD